MPSTRSARGRLLTAQHAADYLGVSVHKLRRIVRSGDLAVLRTREGRLEGIYEQDCDEWVARHRRAAGERRASSPASAPVDAEMQRLIRTLEE